VDIIFGDMASITLDLPTTPTPVGVPLPLPQGPVVSVTVTNDNVSEQLAGIEYRYQYFRDGIITRLESTEAGGNTGNGDTITGGIGDDTLFGGAGQDIISDEGGNDFVFGDHALITYLAGIALVMASRSVNEGDADIITLLDGDHTILGGAGGDTITTANGHDRVLGDNGELTYTTAGELIGMTSADVAEGGDLGGNDTITLGDGEHQVIGGVGGDTITTGDGTDHILADNGNLQFDTATQILLSANSTEDNLGGDDILTLGDGEKLVIGGFSDDTIVSGTGDSILIGDNGTATFAADGKRIQVVSDLSTLGGNDTITANGGNNLVLGGVGNDEITTGAGADRIFGDNGQIDYLNGILTRVATTDTDETTGGIDTIEAGDGDNIIFGGTHGDDIDSGTGNSILMGDNGFVQLNNTGDQRVDVVSEVSTLGGNDDIRARGGNNLGFGSVGDDRIETGAGDGVIFGENGLPVYVNGLPDSYRTTDTTMATSGDDTLIGGAGDDLIFGGLGDELVFAGAGDDKIVGDLGQADYNTGDTDPATLDQVYSTNSETGGSDEIHGGDDNDVIIGGAQGDQLYGDAGDDFISGDGGLAVYSFGSIVQVEASEFFVGGDDLLDGGPGNDIMFGGFGDDLFYGNLSEDAMVGEYARAVIDSSTGLFEKGVFVVRLGQGNLDIIASTQFGLYNSRLTSYDFTPLAMLTPLNELSYDESTETGVYSDNLTRHHASGMGNNSGNSGNVAGTLPSSGIDDEEEACFDPLNGMSVECPVEEPVATGSIEAELPETEQMIPQDGTQADDQPVETDSVEEPPQETESEGEQPMVPAEDMSEAGTAAAIVALAGWKVASGERSAGGKLSVKGFSELRHKQRRVKRWNEATQSFIETEEMASVSGKDWLQALKNTTKH